MKKSAILSTLAMVLVVAVALVGATYAWFTMQDSVTAQSGTLTVRTPAGQGLTIAGNTTWGSNLLWDVTTDNGKDFSRQDVVGAGDFQLTDIIDHHIVLSYAGMEYAPEVTLEATFTGGAIRGAARLAVFQGDGQGPSDTLVAFFAGPGADENLNIGLAAGVSFTADLSDGVHFLVIVWIQGGDSACVNANAGQSFEIALTFTAVTPD
jgi:hypothetical protein